MEWNFAVSFAAALLCGGVALLAFLSDPRSFVHRVLALGVFFLGLTELFAALGDRAVFLSDLVRWQQWRLIPAALLPATWLVFSLSFARADYREAVRKWRALAIAAAALPLAIVSIFWEAIFAIPADWGEFLVTLLPLGWAGWLFHLCFLLASVLVLMNLEGTLRAAIGSQRWQIKFVVLGVGSWFAVQVYLLSQALLFARVDLSLEPVNSCAIVAADLLVLVGLVRTRLRAVELYLSPRLITNSITLGLVGAYLIAVGILAGAVDYLGGSDNFSLVVFFVFLALLVLAVVLLSDQLRLGLRRFVTRNLRRPRYDYRKEWMGFTERTTSVVEVRELCAAVAKMAAETFGVPAVNVWLVDEPRNQLSLGGSTVLSESGLGRQPSLLEDAAALLRHLRSEAAVIDFEDSAEAGSVELRQAHASFFTSSQTRYAVPLVAARRLIAVMTLSDRASREGFSLEDFDLLKTVADQAAGALLNLELSQRLVKAKEMEAFQTLSAFFTHDLKNLASMLSLTVQNLPANFDNPEFRRDALRVISESVAKMDTMCSRLSAVSHELEVDKHPIDLSELVGRVLGDLDGPLRARLLRELHPVRRISADAELIEKVLVNLVLNAGEAVGDGGMIRVGTDERDGLAVVTVSDDGCGMSEEFIAKSLFQPFRTTKSAGLGIGLFQSRRIVEAHGGRIEVESRLGRGSTFRVELPLG